ncbi:MAG: pyrroline-5-carboxylate reductase [Pseudorhodoplanes sp.]|nr:MAG: pyrroline-5-carboxylate reductase [Pseudorhodoplanes sp.]
MTTAENVASLEKAGTLTLVGAGKMGAAMLEGWLARGLPARNVTIFEPQPSNEVALLARKGVSLNPDKTRAPKSAVTVLAVKPQVATEVAPTLAVLVPENGLVISIMAGKTLAFLEAGFAHAAIIRSMPNTPAAIGRGITVAVANARVSPEQRNLADALLRATGAVEWVNDEKLMDAVTAVSGSGPAYVFLLAEAMAKAGMAAGLPSDLAVRLARVTVEGAGELMHRSPLDPATLRKNVTSPAGTTAAALEVLMAPGALDELMTQAVAAATKRSRELAG